MSTTSTPALERSSSVTTGTSYSTDIDKEKGEARHLDIPEPIEEVDESNNVGYAAYKEGLNHEEITAAQNRTIRWRIDLVIMPIFLITQTLQFLDVCSTRHVASYTDYLRPLLRKPRSITRTYSVFRKN